MLSHSMSFDYNFDEKKNRFPARAIVCLEFAHSLQDGVGLLRVLCFPPSSQRCACEVSWCVYIVLVSEGRTKLDVLCYLISNYTKRL